MIRNINTVTICDNLLTSSEDYITIASPDTVRKYVNKAYCDFYQQPPSALIGASFTDPLSEDIREYHKDQFSKMTPDNPTISSTHKSGPNGHKKWVSWKETGFFDENGKLIEILLVGRNVDNVYEAKKEKENLISTLTAFKQAIDTNIICTITDSKGVITYANEKFCKISKYSLDELIGQTHRIVNSGYHQKEYFADIWKTITAGNAWTGELKNKAKDGTYYWVESVIMPIVDTKGSITGYLSLRILIDEQKKMEEAKTAYLKTMEKMLFTVSHEIRKPITTCQGILQLIEDKLLSEKEYHEAISHLVSSASEMDDYSRKLNEYLEKNIKIVQQ